VDVGLPGIVVRLSAEERLAGQHAAKEAQVRQQSDNAAREREEICRKQKLKSRCSTGLAGLVDIRR
jgi:hypothetical protein